MYQPAHLDGFLRLLVSHLGTVIDEGERLIEWQSREMHLDILQLAIEQGPAGVARQDNSRDQRDSEALFVLQMSQAREWVDRLGQLDPEVEREADEFLAATFSIEKHLCDRRTRETDYQLENRLTKPGCDQVLREKLVNNINIDTMMCAIYELLGRLEEQYDLMEDLLEVRQVANGVPFGSQYLDNRTAKIIPLFANIKKSVHQDNAPGN